VKSSASGKIAWIVGLLILALVGWAAQRAFRAESPPAATDASSKTIAAALADPPPAGDWPQWRYDAGRTATCPGGLPDKLHLQWVREYPALEPAWEDPVNQDRMPFDRVYEPVVMGSRMFFGSNRNDRVTALDTRSGQELWRFYADGPVRFPPVAADGKVYFVSDDGYLYCVAADSGRLVWKFRGGPASRKVLGNSRLISAWPARGGPVLKDGTVYFAASIWPFMGVFIHALDAQTGKVIWTSSGTGATYMAQPHNGADAFGGVAPQGSMAVVGDRLIVPGGRSVPACFDRATGELLYYHLSGSKYHGSRDMANNKLEGGSHVSGIGSFYLNHRGLNTSLYDLATGEMYVMWKGTTYPVLTDEVCYLSGNPIVAYSLKDVEKIAYHHDEKDRRSKIVRNTRRYRWDLAKLWECPVDATGALIKAGRRLYAGGENIVSALDVSGSETPEVVWTADIEGAASRIIAADQRLFVVTREGRIYAFGADEVQPKTYPIATAEAPPVGDPSAPVADILKRASVNRGYCLVFGLDKGRLVEDLARNSEFRVIAVDPDPEKVTALRRKFDAAGLYGTRISLHVGDPTTFEAPPYVAVLTTSENLAAAGFDKGEKFVGSIFHSMRPYGGAACLPIADKDRQAAFSELVAKCNLPGAKVTREDTSVVLTREGPLPGSADWTQQYGDMANTLKSDDKLVKLPLGLLWFGGNSHHDILPRHAHGPTEQVVGGRLFVEGINMLSARDVYTGQVLWKRTFDDLGTFGVYYDPTYADDPLNTTYNQTHIAGANARGTNFVATDDKVYLAKGGQCLVLNSATGRTITTFSLPAETDAKEPSTWGYIGVYQDLLIAGSQFVRYSRKFQIEPEVWNDFDTTSSRKLVIMDRHTGRVLWTRDSEHGFRHSAIAAGAGRLFCIDILPHPILHRLILRGKTPQAKATLMALDARSGTPLWQTTKSVFGTWLGYSEEHDILLQSGRHSADMIAGEPTERMIAYRGADGTPLWDKDLRHSGPCMIHGETAFLNASRTATGNVGAAVSLLTGELKMRKHPLTGEEIPWQYHRTYGCNSVVASEYLLTFRSGAAGFYDLVTNSGTGNLGGFKSGCTSNLIAANGVLNAPDYTRTCTCPYQNQTSLALVHMGEVETWTAERFVVMEEQLPTATSGPAANGDSLPGYALARQLQPPARIRRLGINLGAPGDRMAPGGTLWLDCPAVGGPSPDVYVVLNPGRPVRAKRGEISRFGRTKTEFAGRTFRFHSSRIAKAHLKWVAASGLIGLTDMTITLAEMAEDEASYTVRLHFAEPEDLQPGERVFDVSLQGRTVLSDFDVVKTAGGPRREVVREFKAVTVEGDLHIALTPKSGQAVLCGVEVIQEEQK